MHFDHFLYKFSADAVYLVSMNQAISISRGKFFFRRHITNLNEVRCIRRSYILEAFKKEGFLLSGNAQGNITTIIPHHEARPLKEEEVSRSCLFDPKIDAEEPGLLRRFPLSH